MCHGAASGEAAQSDLDGEMTVMPNRRDWVCLGGTRLQDCETVRPRAVSYMPDTLRRLNQTSGWLPMACQGIDAHLGRQAGHEAAPRCLRSASRSMYRAEMTLR